MSSDEEPKRADRAVLSDALDTSVFDDGDLTIIDGLYPESQDRQQSMRILAEELRINLLDNKGKRTAHFNEIVQLGLLSDNTEYISFDQKLPRPGDQLLTPKGADFLGIDLGRFTIAPEVQQIRDDTQAEVARLMQTRDSRIAQLQFFGNIISREPKLMEACPAQYTPLEFVKEAIMLMFIHADTKLIEILPIHGAKELLGGMQSLGWFQGTTKHTDVFRKFDDFLTETGKERLASYKDFMEGQK
ncbi:MAG: hypothetical protein WC753_04505 [Candidatus Gracilibacteria bacterium]